jgi:hypothetical protein
MIDKEFERVEYSDLVALVDERVAERKTIEYKRQAVGNSDGDKVKFLGGITALANTIGGDYVLGIAEEDGVPVELCGITFESADAEILRLENILMHTIEPRLPNGSYQIKEISGPEDRHFLVLRVEKSWSAPHRVRLNDKFYARNSKGKYPMDVYELRSVFAMSEELPKRMRAFRMDRLERIAKDDELPIELVDGAKIVIHLLPLSAFTRPFTVDTTLGQQIWGELGPINGDGWSGRINLEGVMSYSGTPYQSGKNEAYTQLFRNGCVEAVGQVTFMDEKVIPSEHYEQRVAESTASYLKLLAKIGISGSIYFFMSFLSVKGFNLMVINPRSLTPRPFEQSNMVLPELVIENPSNFTPETLKPVFDRVWNAFGYQESWNFDETGQWRHRR